MWPSSAFSSTAEKDAVADVDEKEVLDEKQGSIIMGIISQLRKGSDLSKVTLPTFVLEPRSMTERFSDFMSHPELLINTHAVQDPMERFLDVVRYYLSGFHIRPHGVKKPYNPVLGELFRCQYDLPNQTKALYICEQVTHHPPMSAYFYASPENNLVIRGEFKPKSKFLGNSAATIMEGGNVIEFMNLPGEVYTLSNPNVYARGILFGTMYMELGDQATVKCAKHDLVCDLEFKVKGFFGGTYNGIGGKIKRESTGEVLYTISGKWADTIHIQKSGSSTKEVFFDAEQAKILPKLVYPESEQEEFESRRLWSRVTEALRSRNMDAATQEKTRIEENQRALVKKRALDNIAWRQRFFEPVGDRFQFKLDIPFDQDRLTTWKRLMTFVFGQAEDPLHQQFWLSEEEVQAIMALPKP